MEEMNNIIETLKKNYHENVFNILINCFLISKLRTEKYNGDDILKNVYPYIFDNIKFDYDSQLSILLIDLMENIPKDDLLGFIYEKTLPRNKRKDMGQFYTRSNGIIEYMLNQINFNFNTDILEPSCGSGSFLTSMLKRLEKNIDNDNVETSLLKIFSHIYANDLDITACNITEANILCTLIEKIKLAYMKNKNFKLPKLNIYNYDFTKNNIQQKMDIIIGNPPFITLYGRRSRNMTEEKRKYYNQFKFVSNKNGNNKFNVAMFFVEKALDLLKPNAKMMFILDISFFEDAYIDLRKYIVQNYTIDSLTVNVNEFEEVASSQLVLLASNTRPNKNHTIQYIDYKNSQITEILQSIWDNSSNKYKFLKPLNGATKSIIEKMNKNKKLDYYFPNKSLRTCCALTGRTEDFIVNKEVKTPNMIFPYLEGSKGIQHKFSKPHYTRFIEYDYEKQLKISDEFKIELEKLGVKNKKRVTLGDKDCYIYPKIFIRQSANEIVCSYTEQQYAANNSIYVLSLKSDKEDDKKKLKYTSALLNSELISYYSKNTNIIRGGNGKIPQIKISDLKRIPLAFSKEYYNEIVDLSDNLQSNYNKSDYEKLNSLVYKIYGIDNNEIQYIKKTLI